MSNLLTENKILYVAPAPIGCDKQHDGSYKRPWSTIKKALSSINSGGTIYLRKGIYTEHLEINTQGTIEAAITITNHNSEKVVFVNKSTDSPCQAFIQLTNSAHITIKGLEFLTNSGTNASAIKIEDNCHHIEISNNFISKIDIDRQAFTIKDSASYPIWVESKTSPCEFITIENNTISDCVLGNGAGILMKGDVSNFKINGNQINDLVGHAICFVAKDGFDGYIDETSNDREELFPRRGSCNDNNITRCKQHAKGILLMAGQSISMNYNRISNCSIGIALETKRYIPVEDIALKNNLIYDNASCAIKLQGLVRNKVKDTYLHRNICLENAKKEGLAGELQVYYISNCVVEYNIFLSSEMGVLFNVRKNYTPSNRFAYNILLSQNLYFECFVWEEQLINFFNYQKQSRQEYHSVFSNEDLSYIKKCKTLLYRSSPNNVKDLKASLKKALEKNGVDALQIRNILRQKGKKKIFQI